MITHEVADEFLWNSFQGSMECLTSNKPFDFGADPGRGILTGIFTSAGRTGSIVRTLVISAASARGLRSASSSGQIPTFWQLLCSGMSTSDTRTTTFSEPLSSPVRYFLWRCRRKEHLRVIEVSSNAFFILWHKYTAVLQSATGISHLGPHGVVLEGFRWGLHRVRYCQVYHRVLYWDPFCSCFILMTSRQSLLHRLGYLLMIASYTAPSALVQTVRPCKGTWILWSDGVVHGAWSSIQKMSNYVHRQWEVTSVVTYFQCPDSHLGITLTDE